MTPSKNENPKKPRVTDLPDAELEVMACLWRDGKQTARQIRETMESYRPMAHGSAVTLLKRLEAKGLVAKEKAPVGKAFVYRPTRQPGPTYRRILRNLSQRIFGGNRVALAASLFETQPPNSEELEKLEELLEELRSKTSGKGPEK